MNPAAPPPQAAQDRLAEQLGELSQGLSANGGGGGLSALLIRLIALIIEALRSIARNLPAATAPGETAPGPSPATPQQQPKTPVRPGTPTARSSSPRPDKPPRDRRTAPKAGAAPGCHPGAAAPTLPRTARPGAPGHTARAKWHCATAPPREPPKNRASVRAAFACPFCYDIAT